MISKSELIQLLESLPEETSREYETRIAAYADKYRDEEAINLFYEIMQEGGSVAYEAFYCLETIYRHNRDYSKLKDLLSLVEEKEEFTKRLSFKHIYIMYNVHSETLFDYNEMLSLAHQSACEMFENAGYHHTFANTFATICEKCLPEDEKRIIDQWYDAALYSVNRAIELEAKYAKFYSTKARIVALKKHYEEANDLLLKAIDLENSQKATYSLLVGNYQYYRTMIAIRKHKTEMEESLPKKEKKKALFENVSHNFDAGKSYAFISYSHNDAKEVLPIIKKLCDNNFNIWYDQELTPGQDWTNEIGKHIAGSSLFVLMISSSSLMSDNVRNEIIMAQNRNKVIVPIFLEDVYLSEGAELQLQRYHWIIKYNLAAERFEQELFKALKLVQYGKIGVDDVKEPKQEKITPEVKFEKQYIEKYSVSKTGNEEENEDLVYVDDDFLAVFDGATSKSKGLWNGKKSGRVTVEIIEEFMRSKSFDRKIDGRTAISMIQSKLCRFSEENNLPEMGVYLCASGVIYSRVRQQIWAVGDCQFSINGKVTTPVKRVDEILSEVRRLAIKCLLLEGKTEEELLENDEARKWIINILERQHYLENGDGEYGFSVFSGKGTINDFQIIDVPDGAEVILASDGYPIVAATLEESEAKLRDVIENDPLCYKQYPSTKGLVKGNLSFDDRSYLRFKI